VLLGNEGFAIEPVTVKESFHSLLTVGTASAVTLLCRLALLPRKVAVDPARLILVLPEPTSLGASLDGRGL